MTNGSERIPETQVDQIKVAYTTRAGGESTAYISQHTGEGTDKHSDLPVILAWSEDAERWQQTDNWEWRWAGIQYVRADSDAG